MKGVERVGAVAVAFLLVTSTISVPIGASQMQAAESAGNSGVADPATPEEKKAAAMDILTSLS